MRKNFQNLNISTKPDQGHYYLGGFSILEEMVPIFF